MKKMLFKQKSDISIEVAYELFFRKCKVKNLSEQSLTYYNDKYRILSSYVDTSEPINLFTRDVVDDYILWLRGKDLKDVTINSYLRMLRAFLYFCMESGYLETYQIKMIKANKEIKQTYTDEELAKLLKRPNMSKCSFAELKTWAYINYLLGTGNRISTALSVRIGDIDFDNDVITLTKLKNRKQQVIPLSHTLADVLSDYLEIRGGNEDDYLFCNDYGTKASTRTYQDLLTKYNHNRGVLKTSSHLFRHTFAKNWILAGGDIIRLQKILGHSDLSVTKEYLNMFGQDLQIDFDKFNPLDRFNRDKGEKIQIKKRA
ncbi:MAG TPA: tyrosine-type recombinase/integrase [Candidatus Dorea intestinavium]|nr:tyrosine-type recombinase/integrase [Candidatus Dorea intestinavium]